MIFGIECALVASVTHEYDEEHSTKCLPDKKWISNSCEGVIVLYEWHFTTEDEMVGWHHWLNEHALEQTLGDGEGQESLVSMGL